MAKILWVIHGYPPQQLAGAEWMAKEINDFLDGPEHDTRVCCDPLLANQILAISWADIVITHLDWSQNVTSACEAVGKPCINLIHHNWEIPHLRIARPNVYCVYNSEWVMKDRGYPHRSLVVRPPVNPARFESVTYNPNGFVTLVNCNAHKGAMIFQKIARACPDLKFLGVKGHHGPQIELRGKNIIQWECQEDIRKVFEVTSILLVPSIYESYGRIGIEAMACGIPVIATDTPGLKESLGDRGVFSSREFIPGWLQNLRSVNKNKPEALRGHADDRWREALKELNQLNDLINEITR